MAEQGVSVTCEGGLDLVGTTHTLFRTPGVLNSVCVVPTKSNPPSHVTETPCSAI